MDASTLGAEAARFIDATPTPFHMCSEASSRLRAAGFRELAEATSWRGKLKAGALPPAVPPPPAHQPPLSAPMLLDGDNAQRVGWRGLFHVHSLEQVVDISTFVMGLPLWHSLLVQISSRVEVSIS